MRIEFTVPKNMGDYSTNKYYSASGKNAWVKRHQDANLWHWMVKAKVRKEKPFNVPVEITFSYDDRLDCSNHSIVSKMIEDGLVQSGIIPGDGRKHVKKITTEFNDEGKIIVEVKEYKNDTV